jgi:hypothetical protein
LPKYLINFAPLFAAARGAVTLLTRSAQKTSAPPLNCARGARCLITKQFKFQFSLANPLGHETFFSPLAIMQIQLG